MNFVEAYICRSQEVIQSAYWSQTQVTIHQIVAYFKREEKLCHQYFVFISDEPRHDAKFVFALLCSLVAQLPKLILKLEYIHYWTDSPTSHNKTIFKIVSCHCKYLKIPSPSSAGLYWLACKQTCNVGLTGPRRLLRTVWPPSDQLLWKQATKKLHVTRLVGLQNKKLIWL